MTTEHLLDAMGLLDDELIQEAEAYAAPRRRKRYGTWLAWAASFVVVLALGYGVTHLDRAGLSGGAGMSGGAQSAPNASSMPGETEMNAGAAGGSDSPAAEEAPSEPGCSGQSDSAVLIDGVVYRSTGEVVSLFPGGDDIRYDLVWYDEASGEARADPYLWYLELEDGTVAVSGAFQSQGWLIFAPVETP